MGEKIGKSWSFNIFSSDKGISSIKGVIFAIILTLIVQGVVWVKNDRDLKRDMPILSLNTLIADIREFQIQAQRLPKSFEEIKNAVWVKSKNKNFWSLDHGRYVFVHKNYEYIYYYDRLGKREVINLWAIPKGRHRDSFETFFVAIDSKNEEIWKGAALTKDNRRFVIENGFNPSVEKMVELNMVVYKRDVAKKKKSVFGF